MIRRWEKFTAGPPEPRSSRRYVSINPRGLILFNEKVYLEFGKPEAVVLLFDKANSMIGLSPANRKLKEAFPVRSKDSYWFVRASVFCRHHGIRLNTTERFADPEIDGEGIMLLDLTRTVSAAQLYPNTRKRNL